MNTEQYEFYELRIDTLEKELAKARKVVAAARSLFNWNEKTDRTRDIMRLQRLFQIALAEYDTPQAGEEVE